MSIMMDVFKNLVSGEIKTLRKKVARSVSTLHTYIRHVTCVCVCTASASHAKISTNRNWLSALFSFDETKATRQPIRRSCVTLHSTTQYAEAQRGLFSKSCFTCDKSHDEKKEHKHTTPILTNYATQRVSSHRVQTLIIVCVLQ